MRALLTVPISAALVVLLAACGGSDDGGTTSAASAPAASSAAGTSSAAASSLEDTSWTLTTVGPAAAEPGGLLAFAAGGQMTGSTGCNTFGGTYKQDGSALQLTIGFQTAKACAPPLDVQETAVTAALPKTASFTSDGTTLTLLDGSGQALLAYGPGGAATLTGPAWEVTGINNGKQAVASPIVGSTVTATFGADGTVSGSAGCNSYSASYTLTGDTLKVGPAAATRKLCDSPDGVMDQEAAFLKALEASVSVESDSHGMTLRDASGATQLTLGRPG
jgi:heat shock protein HslJ